MWQCGGVAVWRRFSATERIERSVGHVVLDQRYGRMKCIGVNAATWRTSGFLFITPISPPASRFCELNPALALALAGSAKYRLGSPLPRSIRVARRIDMVGMDCKKKDCRNLRNAIGVMPPPKKHDTATHMQRHTPLVRKHANKIPYDAGLRVSVCASTNLPRVQPSLAQPAVVGNQNRQPLRWCKT